MDNVSESLVMESRTLINRSRSAVERGRQRCMDTQFGAMAPRGLLPARVNG